MDHPNFFGDYDTLLELVRNRVSIRKLKPDPIPGAIDLTVRLQASGIASELDRIFLLSTRRGKQFNSMIQRDVDPLTGAGRDAVLVSQEDLARLGLGSGQRVRLSSVDGVFEGRLRQALIKPGNLEVHWPEGNTLLSGAAIDPDSMEPDYNAVVTLEAEQVRPVNPREITHARELARA